MTSLKVVGVTWVGALVILVFIAIWVGVKVKPTVKAMAAAIQRGPIDPEEWKVLSGRMYAALNVEGAALVLVVILMILKPDRAIGPLMNGDGAGRPWPGGFPRLSDVA